MMFDCGTIPIKLREKTVLKYFAFALSHVIVYHNEHTSTFTATRSTGFKLGVGISQTGEELPLRWARCST